MVLYSVESLMKIDVLTTCFISHQWRPIDSNENELSE